MGLYVYISLFDHENDHIGRKLDLVFTFLPLILGC
jgi:hypothetical protein